MAPPRKKQQAEAPHAPRPSSRDDLPALRQARALWANEQLSESLALFERTVRKNPDHPLAVIDASRALSAFYRIREAEALLGRLEKRIARKPDLLQLVGQSYRLMRRPEAARRCLEAAVRQRPELIDAHLELALLNERSGDLAATRENLQARLRLDSHDAESLCLLGRVQRRDGETAEAIVTLERVASDASAHWLTRARACSELAHALEAEDRPADAWAAAWRGKTLAEPHGGPARAHRDRQRATLDRLVDEHTAERDGAWRDRMAAGQGVALLTGLPRSGTTLLAQILGRLPGATVADEADAFPRFGIPLLLGSTRLEELDSGSLDAIPDDRAAGVAAVYRRMLAESLGRDPAEEVVIDKNPSLLPIVPLYRRVLPGALVIVCLRDPRDVLVSAVLNHFPLNDFSVDLLTLESAAYRIERDLLAWEHLRPTLSDRAIEIRYESLVESPQTHLAPLLQRLNLVWRDEAESPDKSDADRLVYSRTYAEVAQPISQRPVGRWRRYADHLSPVLPQLNGLAARFGYAS